MSYLRWIFFTTSLLLVFTTSGVWLEAGLRGEPAAIPKSASIKAASSAIHHQILLIAKPGFRH